MSCPKRKTAQRGREVRELVGRLRPVRTQKRKAWLRQSLDLVRRRIRKGRWRWSRRHK